MNEQKNTKAVNTRFKKPSKKVCNSVACLKREKHHPILHHIHKKHAISYKTLFYMKEYGPHSHVAGNIIKESIKILILTSLISSFGGIGLQSIQDKIFLILPLIILLPALNDMTGDMGTIVSSKFTTMLYLRKIGKRWWASHELRKLFTTIVSIAFIASIYVGLVSTIISVYHGYALTQYVALSVLLLSIVSTLVIVGIIFLISIVGGIFIYNRKEDPNNFLIPITTSVADFGAMLVLAFFVGMLF